MTARRRPRTSGLSPPASQDRPAASRVWRRGLALTVLAALAGACASSSTGASGGPAPPSSIDSQGELAIANASFDLAVGEDQRFTAGVLTQQAELVAFGEVTMRFGFLGEDSAGQAELTQHATATFLPVPGLEPEGESDAPTILTDTPGSGVYETQVDFDRAGFWGVLVEATLADGSTRTGTTTVAVAEQHQVPTVGDRAPATHNLTLDSDAPRVAIDSRAQDGGDIPDPELHERTIAEALDAGRPVLVTFSTPVYCTSRFCGPITDTVAALAGEYEDRAEFIHVEVWRDFEAARLNDAAAEWIQPEGGSAGNEPWTFLVGGDGRILARWDNVADLAQLRALLDELPAA